MHESIAQRRRDLRKRDRVRRRHGRHRADLAARRRHPAAQHARSRLGGRVSSPRCWPRSRCCPRCSACSGTGSAGRRCRSSCARSKARRRHVGTAGPASSAATRSGHQPGLAGLPGAADHPGFSLEFGQEDIGATSPDTTERQAYDLITAGFGVGYNGPLQVAIELDPVATPSDEYTKKYNKATSLQKQLEQDQKQLPKQQKQLEKQQKQLETQQAQLTSAGSALKTQQASLQARATSSSSSRRSSSSRPTGSRPQQAQLEAQKRQLETEQARARAQGRGARGRGQAAGRAARPARGTARVLERRIEQARGRPGPAGAAASPARSGPRPRGRGRSRDRPAEEAAREARRAGREAARPRRARCRQQADAAAEPG